MKKVFLALDQEVTQKALSVEGSVPEWLQGTFVRNGPVSVQIDNQKIPHWFDGLAMLHSFSFHNGKIFYSNKFLRTEAYQQVFSERTLNYEGFANPYRRTLWSKIKDFFSLHSNAIIQNANVNVAQIAHQYVALTETPLPVSFDIKTLDTLGVLRYEDQLPKKNIFDSAHIQYDRKTEEKFNYLVNYGRKSQYIIYRLDPKRPYREVIGKINVKKPSYMHSFALTEHYVILVEFPFIVDPIDLLIMKKPFIKNFYWNAKQGTHFLIIDRKTGKLIKSIKHNDPFFAFHHVNAYEENDKIILDIIAYPEATIISTLGEYGDLKMPSEQKDIDLYQIKLMRYIVSFKTNIVQPIVLFDMPLEFPKINEQYNAYSYRYLYAIDARPLIQKEDLRPIYKIDVIKGEKTIWQEPGLLPGEPIFIPKPDAKEEDEGIIIDIVLDTLKDKAFLLILDGQSFKEIGRSYAPYSIPLGLHGQFFK